MKDLILDGYLHYKVSEDGRVYAPHLKKYIKDYDNGLGYRAVKLRKTNGERKQHYVHRLVASQYIENVGNHSDVNHKDGDKNNNSVTNLEWLSHKDNLKHAFKAGLLKGPAVEVGYQRLVAV